MATSPENTGLEQTDTDAVETNPTLTRVGEVTPVDFQVDALQRRLEQSEDQRKEERFLWFMLSGLLLVTLIFSGAGTAAGTFSALIYVAMALVLSRRWGFEDLWGALHAAKELLGFKGGAGDEE